MTDNLLVGWDAVCYLPRTKLYGQLFLDNYEFNDDQRRAQRGRRSRPAPTAPRTCPVDARLEYTRVTRSPTTTGSSRSCTRTT